MKLMRITPRCTWKYYKTNEDILSELKINPRLKKIENYINEWVHNVRRMDRDRLPH
jgi:hypothetical protein